MSRRLAALLPLVLAACGDDIHRTSYLSITVDVEAQPERQTGDWVNRLIYGDFGPGKRAGIDEMMDIADAHDVKLTFFVDVVEETLYPGEIAAVARHIAARGHDVELHTHPDIAPDSFWLTLGRNSKATNDFSRDDAEALFSWCASTMAPWGLPAPIAYRAGGYRYSPGILAAMPDFGLTYSYNYNVQGKSQADSNIGLLPMFRWENDVVELPVSYVPDGDSPQRFDWYVFPDGDPMKAVEAIGTFRDAWPEDNVLTMMMHSWSFLYLEGQYFQYEDDALSEQFDRFLAALPADVRVVTATDIAELIDNGDLAVEVSEDFSDVFPSIADGPPRHRRLR